MIGCGGAVPERGGAASRSGVGRSASGSGTGGPPSSAGGNRFPTPRSGTPPMTRIWVALMSPDPAATRACGSPELTAIPPPLTVRSPNPRFSSAPGAAGSSRHSTQLLGAAGPAAAAARARMLFEVLPNTGANAYCTWTGGVVTWSAFDPSGQLPPGPGGPAGRTQQTTSPLVSEPSLAQPA